MPQKSYIKVPTKKFKSLLKNINSEYTYILQAKHAQRDKEER